jgi:leader peptidase (prepilin peptidase)/N-methyltransferase
MWSADSRFIPHFAFVIPHLIMWLALFLFALGACIGSFLNVCIWRLPRHESVVQPPSHCPKCDTRLQVLDLVPLFSQLFLRSRCRYCGSQISWRYFGIEFLTGALFALVGLQPEFVVNGQWVGDPAHLLRGLIFMAALVVIFWVDYDVRLIQLEAVLLLGLAGIGLEAWRNYQAMQQGYSAFGPTTLTQGPILERWTLFPAPLPESLAAMIVTAFVLWFLREVFSWIYGREAMGFGDVLLVGGIAANLGWNATVLTFFFLAFVAGAPLAISLQVPAAVRAYRWAKKRQGLYGMQEGEESHFQKRLPQALARRSFRRAIPFGPMLAIAGVLALLYGGQINQAYLNLWQ